MSTRAIVDTSEERRNRRWPEALKREIVAATFRPGASVSVVARQYDVNANQVFSWRRRYGDTRDQFQPPSSGSELVPVTVTTEPESEASGASAPMTSGTIEIEVSGTYRVKVGASFDARTLKRVLDVLRAR